ncbi:MAG: UDP-N-acetylglucosamine pyrophosphorylase, partial [Clostridia bacterium]|nr:UDP-N-acetylglucosamine pyrophosphorylase [Clostridia bacterium]
MYKIKDLFDLEHTMAKDYLEQFEYPWEALKDIKDMIVELGEKLPEEEYEEVSKHVW